jgi:hypothetical protein
MDYANDPLRATIARPVSPLEPRSPVNLLLNLLLRAGAGRTGDPLEDLVDFVVDSAFRALLPIAIAITNVLTGSVKP